MNKTTVIRLSVVGVLSSSLSSQAAWVWAGTSGVFGDVPTGTPQNTSSSSLAFSLTPAGAGGTDYDFAGTIPNLGFDVPPPAVDIIVSSSTGEISWKLDTQPFGTLDIFQRLVIDIDPLADGAATDLSVGVSYSLGLTERGNNGGGIGLLATGANFGNFDVAYGVFDINGDQIVLDSSYPFLTGLVEPASFTPSGTAIFDDVIAAPNAYAGLQDSPTATTYFNYPTSAAEVDPTQQIGSIQYNVSDINLLGTNTNFVFSLDGGVSAFALPVPEPTLSSLLGIVALSCWMRRRN